MAFSCSCTQGVSNQDLELLLKGHCASTPSAWRYGHPQAAWDPGVRVPLSRAPPGMQKSGAWLPRGGLALALAPSPVCRLDLGVRQEKSSPALLLVPTMAGQSIPSAPWAG